MEDSVVWQSAILPFHDCAHQIMFYNMNYAWSVTHQHFGAEVKHFHLDHKTVLPVVWCFLKKFVLFLPRKYGSCIKVLTLSTLWTYQVCQACFWKPQTSVYMEAYWMNAMVKWLPKILLPKWWRRNRKIDKAERLFTSDQPKQELNFHPPSTLKGQNKWRETSDNLCNYRGHFSLSFTIILGLNQEDWDESASLCFGQIKLKDSKFGHSEC